MNSPDIKLPSNRKFGFFFCFIFFIVATYSHYSNFSFISYIFGLLTIILFAITICYENKLKPFNHGWMRLGVIIGSIISPIVLGSIFFLIFTPIAFIMRIFGRDELALNSLQKSSYWVVRKEEIHSESFKNQF